MKIMKSTPLFLTLLFLVCCLPFVGFKYYSYSQERAAKVRMEKAKPVPYTVYATETITDPQGRTSVSQKYVFAQRSDGAFMEQRQEVFRPVHNQSREVYFTDGRKAQVEDHVRAASTCYIGDNEKFWLWNGRPDPNTDCARSYLGEAKHSRIVTPNDKLFFGISVTKIVQEDPGRRLTLWRAPSLSCQVLMRVAEFRDSDKVEYSTPSTLVVDRIDFGEPDSSLFDVPESYDNVPPSELVAKSLAANGVTLSPSAKARYSKADARYFRQKANKQ